MYKEITPLTRRNMRIVRLAAHGTRAAGRLGKCAPVVDKGGFGAEKVPQLQSKTTGARREGDDAAMFAGAGKIAIDKKERGQYNQENRFTNGKYTD